MASLHSFIPYPSPPRRHGPGAAGPRWPPAARCIGCLRGPLSSPSEFAMSRFAVILPADGQSSRFRDKVKKVFANIDGRAVWLRACEPFANRNDVAQTILVVAPDDLETFRSKFGAHLG